LESQELARIFRVLSVDTRVRIIQLLKQNPLCVNALACRLGVTPAAVSQHLHVLREADLVKPEKKGYFVHYAINESKLTEWLEITDNLLDHDSE
jgi:DNA-binding transcriptional ArsR family regulator